MKAYETENISIYLFTAGFCVWSPFSLLSGLSIAKTGLLINLAGPLLIALTRFALMLAEHSRLKLVLYSQRHEMYIRTYYNNPGDTGPAVPEHQTAAGKLRSSVFLQVDGWPLFLSIAAAIALIIVGVRFATQKWALWMGLAILTELVMRLFLEILWRKTEFGRFIPRWLATQAWWNNEYVAEHQHLDI